MPNGKLRKKKVVDGENIPSAAEKAFLTKQLSRYSDGQNVIENVLGQVYVVDVDHHSNLVFLTEGVRLTTLPPGFIITFTNTTLNPLPIDLNSLTVRGNEGKLNITAEKQAFLSVSPSGEIWLTGNLEA